MKPAVIEYPHGARRGMLLRLVGLSSLAIFVGLAILLFARAGASGDVFSSPEGPAVLGLGFVLVGLIVMVVAVVALKLHTSWQLVSLKIAAANRPVRLEFGPDDMGAEGDADEDDSDAGGGGGARGASRDRLQRGDHLEAAVVVRSLREVWIDRALFRAVVKKKVSAGSDIQKTLHTGESEDVYVRERHLNENDELGCSFKLRLPEDVEPSSELCSWTLELYVKARGALDYRQKKTLIVA